MLCIPSSLNELLLLCAPCFTQPSFRTFTALVVGQISQTQKRCVTGMLIGARLSGVWHHARAHRFFSHARWSADELGLKLAELIVERLLKADAPLIVPVDDSLLKRRGRRIFGCCWHHDATANSRTSCSAWGNNWVTAGIDVKLPFLQRTVCLLVLFRLWRPRRPAYAKIDKPDPERPSKPQLAREMACLLAARFPQRAIHLAGDAHYASGTFADLPQQVTLTARLRSDAALHELAPPRPPKGQRRRGRPRKRGRKLAKLAEIAADPAAEWVKTTVCRYGKTEQVMACAFTCLWYQAFGSKPMQVVIVKDTKPCSDQLALISTDTRATAAELIERYADRWATEVAYEDGKELFGVGDARNRTEKAVQRTVPFQFLTMTLTIVWYALAGHHPDDAAEHRARCPWYLTKAAPSFADMLAKLRRVIIASQFRPGRGYTPTPREITQVQQAWAAAGA
jgi:SRSO17 transposase